MASNKIIKYSIIIPHYESIEFLENAVASVPDRDDIEVIVVDNSRKKISERLFDNRQNVCITYSEKGAGKARNHALPLARGEWILFLDSDDYFLPNAFSYIEEYSSSEADIVYFSATSIDLDTGKSSFRERDIVQLINNYLQNNDEVMIRYKWSSPWSKMIKKKLITDHNIRFDEIPAGNDVIFSLLCGYYAKSVIVSDKQIYCITQHSNSLTTTPSLENLQSRLDVTLRYNKFIKQNRLPIEQTSIMIHIYTIYKYYGLLTANHILLEYVVKGGNPFVGITRWFKTWKELHKRNR